MSDIRQEGSMDSRYIEENQVIEHYVSDRLTPEEKAEFEEYYLDHPELIDEIEAAEGIRDGFRGLATRELARTGLFFSLLRGLQKRSATLLVVLLAVPLAWVSFQNISLRSQLEQNGPARPGINTPVFTLNPVRSGTPETTDRLRIGPDDRQVVVILDLELTADVTYAAILTNTDREIWRSDGLVPDYAGSLRIAFPTRFLKPATYDLTVARTGSKTTTATFRFEVILP